MLCCIPVLCAITDVTELIMTEVLHGLIGLLLCSFQFSPIANGMYAETWVLHTHPTTPKGPCSITLRGAAVEADTLGRNRRKVAAMLADREKTSKVR